MRQCTAQVYPLSAMTVLGTAARLLICWLRLRFVDNQKMNLRNLFESPFKTLILQPLRRATAMARSHCLLWPHHHKTNLAGEAPMLMVTWPHRFRV